MKTQTSARSVYVHVPFCRHRCGYCNFSVVAGRDYLADRYLDALHLEMANVAKEYAFVQQPLEIDTLFLGGGTPSHLDPRQLQRLADILFRYFRLADNAEVTAECNPNDITADKVHSLQSIGVTRISLGVQSFAEQKLKHLERDHTADEVITAFQLARSAFSSVSLDLIFAAPHETSEAWAVDLRTAISLQPDHLSTYELTFEKGTQFWNRLRRGDLHQTDEDLRATMYQWTVQELDRTGWEHYELSSFAKAGHRCRHNLVYWSGDDYLAFGPGASRFVDGSVRETNHQSTSQYLKLVESGASPVAHRQSLHGLDAAKEMLAIGLRNVDGVGINRFASKSGCSVDDVLGETKSKLLELDLVEFVTDADHNERVRLTPEGIMLYDGVAAMIV
ncbi:MAG: radical SAM family heme chaperone HemW [Planctomycetota bacterium]